MAIKVKRSKWDYIKLKCFYTEKEIIDKMKRQPNEWEEIMVNHINDKELIYKLHKKFIQLNSKKTKQSN